MKSKRIKLLVTVSITYENETQLQEAIERAKECVTSQSILGDISAIPKNAKLLTNQQLQKLL